MKALEISETCPSCGVKQGELHTSDCNMQRCPFCGRHMSEDECVTNPPYGFPPTYARNKDKSRRTMNNGLQFRAWHKDTMYEVVGLDWNPTCLTASLKRKDGVVFGEDNYYDGDTSYVLMAYTGQRSIDNHKIYDKDLLRFPNQNEIYEVRWDNHEGAWGIFYKDGSCRKIGLSRFMQIVGNSCENPELLEAD